MITMDENKQYKRIDTQSELTHSEAIDLVNAVFMLHDFFDDFDKVALWLVTPNPNLGGAIPINSFYTGRGHKVLQFIKAAKDERL